MTVSITEDDLRNSIADALQFISCYHPRDYVHRDVVWGQVSPIGALGVCRLAGFHD